MSASNLKAAPENPELDALVGAASDPKRTFGCPRTQESCHFVRPLKFNGGLDNPVDDCTFDGDILIWVQPPHVSVVRLNILRDDGTGLGPHLEYALNTVELQEAARAIVEFANSEALAAEKESLFRCPPELASRAKFGVDA